jgi:sulfatase maturation enzyme AslB (radical SAM superfamily)
MGVDMNEYIKKLNKIEFVVTYACTGKCKHCSEGEHSACGEYIKAEVAADAVKRVASEYDIKTVMTFGGEPLLYADTVYAIMAAAREMGVPNRQVITNGYFSKDRHVISNVAKKLAECGVNDLLLSVDAFHQENIPIDTVKKFATEAQKRGISLRLQPAWLVSPSDDNVYNYETRRIIDSFSDMHIKAGSGNIIFPEGNAIKYLAEYFKTDIPENPYIEDPFDIRCISFEPNGDVLKDNVYRSDIMDILNGYKP